MNPLQMTLLDLGLGEWLNIGHRAFLVEDDEDLVGQLGGCALLLLHDVADLWEAS